VCSNVVRVSCAVFIFVECCNRVLYAYIHAFKRNMRTHTSTHTYTNAVRVDVDFLAVEMVLHQHK